MNAELIIFDCDGVLVDSEVLAEKSLFECLNAHGFLIDEAAVGRYVGISTKSTMAAIEEQYQKKLPEDFRDILSQGTRKAFDGKLKAIDGVVELIKKITVKKCVASGSSVRGIELRLKLTEIWDLFVPHIFSSEQVKHGKPAPDLFLFTANQMGVKPEHCLVIEDSVPGVRAARAAGMRVLGFYGGSHCNAQHADKLKEAGAELVFPDMKSLAEKLFSDKAAA